MLGTPEGREERLMPLAVCPAPICRQYFRDASGFQCVSRNVGPLEPDSLPQLRVLSSGVAWERQAACPSRTTWAQ